MSSWCPNTDGRLRGFKMTDFSGSGFNSHARMVFMHIRDEKKRDDCCEMRSIRDFCSIANRTHRCIFNPRMIHIDDRALTWSQRRSCDENRRPVVIHCCSLHPTAKLSVRTFESAANLTRSYRPRNTLLPVNCCEWKSALELLQQISPFSRCLCTRRRSSVAILRLVVLPKRNVSIKLILR